MGVSLLGAVLVMALAVPAEPLGIDQRWSEAMLDIRTSPLTNLALIFNWLGHGLGWLLSLGVIGIVLFAQRRPVALLAFGVTETVTPLTSTLLKALVGRPRPPDGLVHPLGSSFPSGHAAYAGATCVALVLLFTEPGPNRARWWWPLAALGVLGMAWSRTYLQVHWLSDVIGGSLLGVGIGLATFAGLQLINSRRSAGRATHTVQSEPFVQRNDLDGGHAGDRGNQLGAAKGGSSASSVCSMRASPSRPERTPHLTPRQAEVLALLDQGRSTKQVATELHLTPNTVRNHVRDLLQAFGVTSRLEAVAAARAAQLGLIDARRSR